MINTTLHFTSPHDTAHHVTALHNTMHSTAMIHITNTQSLAAGVEQPTEKRLCPACLQNTMFTHTWISVECNKCRFSICSPETWAGHIVKHQREKVLKLTRRQLSEVTGYAANYIKKCEFVRCSTRYIDTLKSLVANGGK